MFRINIFSRIKVTLIYFSISFSCVVMIMTVGMKRHKNSIVIHHQHQSIRESGRWKSFNILLLKMMMTGVHSLMTLTSCITPEKTC